MENWEFLLQRKGDKSWLPLESPTVEILEGQYRLAARSDLANVPAEIAIAYRPIADVRHQPFQQKIVKRISHDGLLIVMPYTNFVPGLWQIDCCATGNAENDANSAPAWKKTVKFDVIQISSDASSEWQYNDPDEDLETSIEIPTDFHTNALGIAQTEPTPLSYNSPILEIAQQRSTELVQSMFDEFALFNDDDINDEDEESEQVTGIEVSSDRPNLLAQVNPDSAKIYSEIDSGIDSEVGAPLPSILLRLKQPQYIVNEDNSFTLTGDAYTNGEIEVILKDPQTLDVIVNKRYTITNLSDRIATTRAIPFTYQVIVPPPSEIQVLIGEVQIHPQHDSQRDSDLFVKQQAIAVSYPASRVLPEMIKEAQKHSSPDISRNIPQDIPQDNSQTIEESINSSSFPQPSQSFPQGSRQTENLSKNPSPKLKPVNSLSLPPLPFNKPKASQGQSEESVVSPSPLSLPPLRSLQNKASNNTLNLTNSETSADDVQSFPQVEPNELENNELENIELEFAITDFSGQDDDPNLSTYEGEEPELLYSFEEELPQNYEDILDLPRLEARIGSGNRSNRFLNKLQTLSADAIAAQKANQRTEELSLDTLPLNDPLGDALSTPESLSGAVVDLDNPSQPPRTLAEANSLAELDLDLDVELDRLLAPEPDLILNEYVWEETVDPNTFPIHTVSNNSSASALSETAQTIRNIQESSPQSLSEQEPVPIPEIIIPAGELISGTPMIVTVRLPAIAPKFFVKFWIKDLQTRMIVDGPRWLLDFSVVPNTKFIETHTNISIPLSSIDVAFEAIAIEAQTQRESHKVRVTRAVIPPNLAQDLNFNQ